MSRSFSTIKYIAPLSDPVETDAYHAKDDGEWRVVIIPGTPCQKHLYQRLLWTAPDGIEFFVITRPGFGKNHKSAITDFDEQVKAIIPFLNGGDYGDKKTIVLGTSYGGELALKSALDFSDKILGVVTLAALIEEPHDYLLEVEKAAEAMGIEAISPARFVKVRDEIVGRRTQIGPLFERLKDLTVPVEVLHGDFDAVVPKSNAYALMEHLGDNANLEIIPGGTHYLELQYSNRVHEAIKRVMDRVDE